MKGYRPPSFIIQELVSPDIYAAMGERSWELLDPGILMMAQLLRDKFGPVTINNWLTKGQYKESGLRSFLTSTGAKLSQHKYGRALDLKFKNTTPQAVYAYILAHPEEFPYITIMENIEATPTWLHIANVSHDKPGIWIVNP